MSPSTEREEEENVSSMTVRDKSNAASEEAEAAGPCPQRDDEQQ